MNTNIQVEITDTVDIDILDHFTFDDLREIINHYDGAMSAPDSYNNIPHHKLQLLLDNVPHNVVEEFLDDRLNEFNLVY